MVDCFFKKYRKAKIGLILTQVSRTILGNKKANFPYLLGKCQLKNISTFSFVLMFVTHFNKLFSSYRLVNISLPKYKGYIE